MFQKYGKAILAFLYAVAFIAIPLYTGDHHVDPGEGVTIAIAVVTSAGVWLIPLAPSARWTKTAAGASSRQTVFPLTTVSISRTTTRP